MKKLIAILMAAALMPALAFAVQDAEYQEYDQSSKMSGKSLDISAGAAGSGMANAYIGMANDAVSIYWNPAGLANMRRADKEWNFFFSHDLWIQNMSTDYLSIAKKIGKLGVLAAGVSYFNAGELKKYELGMNDTFVENGTFCPYTLTGLLSYSSSADKDLDFGVTGKYIFDNIDGSYSSTMTIDIGTRYYFPYLPGLSLNIVARNFGGMLGKMVVSKDISFSAVYAFTIEGFRTSFAYDAVGRVSNNALHRIGIELKAPSLLTLRAGYQTDNTAETDGFRNFAFGMGLDLQGKFIDFSFEPYGGAGNAVKVSFGGDF